MLKSFTTILALLFASAGILFNTIGSLLCGIGAALGGKNNEISKLCGKFGEDHIRPFVEKDEDR